MEIILLTLILLAIVFIMFLGTAIDIMFNALVHVTIDVIKERIKETNNVKVFYIHNTERSLA